MKLKYNREKNQKGTYKNLTEGKRKRNQDLQHECNTLQSSHPSLLFFEFSPQRREVGMGRVAATQ